jgi:hypothetical protein
MKLKTITIVLALISFISIANAKAGGNEAHGGDLVVCFNVPLEEAVSEMDGRITEVGWNNRQEDYPMVSDYYQIISRPFDESLFFTTESNNPEEIAQEIRDLTQLVPGFHKKWMREANKYPFETWDPAPSGLKDVSDSNELYLLPSNCTYVQGAVMQYGVVSFDTRAREHSDNLQKALLSIHEELYALARGKGQTDSVRTRRLFKDIMLSGGDEVIIQSALIKHGFGQYKTATEIRLMREEKQARLDELQASFTSIEENLSNEELLDEWFELRLFFAETDNEFLEIKEGITRYFNFRLEIVKAVAETEYLKKELQQTETDHQNLLTLVNNGEVSVGSYHLLTGMQLNAMDCVLMADIGIRNIEKERRGFFRRLFDW